MTAVNQSPKTTRHQEVDPEWVIAARRNSEWIEAHHEELLQQYDGQWIAVANQQLVAHDPDPEVVGRQAQAQGFTLALCYFLSSNPVIFAPGAIFVD
jgi:hypothetical protein